MTDSLSGLQINQLSVLCYLLYFNQSDSYLLDESNFIRNFFIAHTNVEIINVYLMNKTK